jgi:hypothetical protein
MSDVLAGGTHGFLWTRGVLYDLNDCVRGTTSAVISQAQAINNRGEIAVNLRVGGVTHAGLLTPTHRASTGQE